MAGTTSLGLPTYAVGDNVTPLATILTAISTSADTAMVALGTAVHARYRCTTSAAFTAGVWSKMYLDVAADSSTSPPYTLNAGARTVTVTTAGVYRIEGVTSMTAATFAARIVADTTNVLVQSTIGVTPSFTTSVAVTRRLTAGAVLQLEVYPTAGMSSAVDAAASPCYLAITRVGA